MTINDLGRVLVSAEWGRRKAQRSAPTPKINGSTPFQDDVGGNITMAFSETCRAIQQLRRLGQPEPRPSSSALDHDHPDPGSYRHQLTEDGSVSRFSEFEEMILLKEKGGAKVSAKAVRMPEDRSAIWMVVGQKQGAGQERVPALRYPRPCGDRGLRAALQHRDAKN
jgi:hypothetical protein